MGNADESARPKVRSTEYLVTQAHSRLRVRHYGPLAVLDAHEPCAQQQLAVLGATVRELQAEVGVMRNCRWKARLDAR